MDTGMLEREGELRQIARAAGAARSGRGCVVLISGEAGIGKSTLVAATRAQLPPESRLLVGHCDDLTTARPLGPFYDLNAAVGPALQIALAAPGQREELLAALLEELQSQPGTVVAIEDVHWADDATLDLLRLLSRRIASLPAVLMLTYRDDEPAEQRLRPLLGSVVGGLRLPLRRLSAATVNRMARSAGLDGPVVYAATAGNPYYLTEVLTAGSADPVPLTVVDAVLAKLHRLGPTAQAAVEQLSVVPAAVEPALVAALLPDGSRAADSIEAAERLGLLSAGARGVVFRHELARRAIADELAGIRRLDLETRVLRALLDRPEPEPARLVHHAVRAGATETIVRYAPIAAREAAASGARRQAAAHFALALEHAEAYSDAERADLLENSAIESYTASVTRRDPVADQLAAVALRRRLGDPVRLGASLRWLSRLYWWQGDRPNAEAVGDEAVSVLERADHPGLLAMAYSNLSQLDMLGDRYERSIELATRAIELARAAGDAGTLSHALCNLGTAKHNRDDPTALDALVESRTVALRAHEFEHACRAYVNAIWNHLEDLDPAAAAALVPDALDVAEQAEQVVFRDYLRIENGMIELTRGHYAAAVELAQDGLRTADSIRCAALILANWAAVRTGAADPARLEEMWTLATGLGELQRSGPAVAVLAEAAWLTGGEPALAEVADRIAGVHATAVECRRRTTMAELGFWLERAGRGPQPRFAGDPYSLQAAGDWPAAARAWAAAGYPYERAAALAESPDADDGRAALAILVRIGALPLANRVRRDLRARGVTSVPRGPAGETRRHALGLTARQAEVLDLLRLGLTNSEIAARLVISERTTDHHVSAILAKLGVHTRAEAAAIADKGNAEIGTDRA